jgi:excisionase family DNA binding protein
MSKAQAGRKVGKKRTGRAAVVRARRAASGMATVDDLAAELGIGKNLAYELVMEGKIKAARLGRRWLIPRATIAKILSGEITPVIAPPARSTVPATP